MTHEVELKTLSPGAEFLLDLGERRLRGVLVELNRGSAVVAVEQRRPPRVITTQDGVRSAPIKVPDLVTHWDLDSLVIPTGELKDIHRWMPKLKGGTMTDEKIPGTVRTKREKKAPKVKAPKELLTTRYAATAKPAEKIGYFNLEKKTHNAVIYRFVAGSKDPVTFAELVTGVDKRTFGSESKNVESIFRWHIADLIKKGFVRSMERREEAAA